MGTWKQDKSGNWKKSSSSKKKNYMVVDGKKVEQTSSTKSAPATSNDTWKKDTVTLEEAKQQTADVERGIINVDTGATSLSSTPSSSISLSDAAKQTETEKRKTAAESANSLISGTTTETTTFDGDTVTKTTETVELHNDLTAIKAGGKIKSAAQMGTVTKKFTRVESKKNPYYAPRMQLGNMASVGGTEKSLTPEQAKRMSSLLNANNTPSGTGQEGTVSQQPGAAQKLSASSQAMLNVYNGVKFGLDSEKNPMTVKTFSADDYRTGYGIYKKGLSVAEGIKEKGSAAVDTGIDVMVAANKYNPLSLVPHSSVEKSAPVAKKFVTGAVVNTGAGLIQGASAVPMALNVAVKEPKALASALVFGVGVMAGSTVKGLKDDPVTTMGELTGALLVGKSIETGVKQFPVKKASLTEIKGGGSSPGYERIDYGTQLQVNGNPLLSYSKQTGLTKGPLAAPAEVLAGKKVTAFGDLQTANFAETLRKLSPDAEYFKSGRNITKSIYGTKTPVKKPSAFKITSENIPDSVKPVVEKAIKSYKGDAEVYGSVAQKMQVQEYMSRKPADLEISVGNADKFVSHLKTSLDESGVRYKIKGEGTDAPKVEFFDKSGKTVKGIEIFKKGKLGGGSGYAPEADIAYGFGKHRSIKVDGIRVMDLREQASRKLSGGLTLQGKTIEPVHAGRLKDVGDLLETGVGHAIEKKPGIAIDVLKFNELARKKYPAVAEIPVSKFMARKGRVPTTEEFTKLVGKKKSKARSSDRELLYSSSGKRDSSALSRAPGLTVSSPSLSSVKPSKAPSRPSKAPGKSSIPSVSVSVKSLAPSVPKSVSSRVKKSSGQSYPSGSGRSGSSWSAGSSGSSGSESIGSSLSISRRTEKKDYITPIVPPIVVGLRKTKRSNESGWSTVIRRIEDTGIKNVWDVLK